MGYASLLEDVTNKFVEVRSMIESSTDFRREKIINGPIEVPEQDKHHISITKEKVIAVSEHETLKKKNKSMAREIATLKYQIDLKEKFLIKLRDKISMILEENEKSKWVMENEHQNAIKKVHGEKAEAELDYKSAILRIGSIVKQPNFHKKQNNINNIILIVKKMTGL
jgi:hypothetical protein